MRGLIDLMLEVGEEMLLGEIEPGLFLFNDTLCFRDDYHDFYIIENGDAFWGGVSTKEERAKLAVRPLKIMCKLKESSVSDFKQKLDVLVEAFNKHTNYTGIGPISPHPSMLVSQENVKVK